MFLKYGYEDMELGIHFNILNRHIGMFGIF